MGNNDLIIIITIFFPAIKQNILEYCNNYFFPAIKQNILEYWSCFIYFILTIYLKLGHTNVQQMHRPSHRRILG